MAVSPNKTFVAGEVLTATDFNAEFLNILNNGQDLGWPRTKSADMDGNTLILDSDADSSIVASTDDRIDFTVGGTLLFRMDGTTASSVNGLNFNTAAAGSAPQVEAHGSDTNVSINLVPKGTGTVQIGGSDLHTADDVFLGVRVFG